MMMMAGEVAWCGEVATSEGQVDTAGSNRSGPLLSYPTGCDSDFLSSPVVHIGSANELAAARLLGLPSLGFGARPAQ